LAQEPPEAEEALWAKPVEVNFAFGLGIGSGKRRLMTAPKRQRIPLKPLRQPSKGAVEQATEEAEEVADDVDEPVDKTF
jgi:hypothetical protein